MEVSVYVDHFGVRCHQSRVLWRNWLARPAVNREVPSSSLGRTVQEAFFFLFFFFFLFSALVLCNIHIYL